MVSSNTNIILNQLLPRRTSTCDKTGKVAHYSNDLHNICDASWTRKIRWQTGVEANQLR